MPGAEAKPVKQNALSINDVTIAEGAGGGTTNFTFTVTVTLQRNNNTTVTVNWTAIDGSATSASGDYVNASGSLVFALNQTSKTVTVVVNGDYTPEATETFTVQLANAVSASLADGSGLRTVVNDDVMPSLSVDDVSLAEGELRYNRLRLHGYALAERARHHLDRELPGCRRHGHRGQ